MSILKPVNSETARFEPPPSHTSATPSYSSSSSSSPSFRPLPFPSSTTDKTADYAETVFAADSDLSEEEETNSDAPAKSRFQKAFDLARNGMSSDQALTMAGFRGTEKSSRLGPLNKQLSLKGFQPQEKLDPGVELLKKNPLQSWSKISQTLKISRYKFGELAKKEGFIPANLSETKRENIDQETQKEVDLLVGRLSNNEKLIDIYSEYPNLKEIFEPRKKPSKTEISQQKTQSDAASLKEKSENNDPIASAVKLRKRKNPSPWSSQTSASSNSPEPDSSQKVAKRGSVQPFGSSQSKSKDPSKSRKAAPPDLQTAYEHVLSGKTVNEALDAAGYRQGRKKYRIQLEQAIRTSTPPPGLSEKLEQAITKLNNNPIQSWRGLVQEFGIPPDLFKKRAAEEGFVPLKKGGTWPTTPQFENERNQIVERLKKGEKFIDIYQGYPELTKRVKPIDRSSPVQDFSAGFQTRQTNDQADFSYHSSYSSSALPPSSSFAAPSSADSETPADEPTQTAFPSQSTSFDDLDLAKSGIPWPPLFTAPLAPFFDLSSFLENDQDTSQKNGDLPEDV